jgi:DNA-binding NtrC family response regulator
MPMTTQLAGAEYPAPPAKIPARVLVIDDEPLVRWALAASLTAAGYDVLTATTGEEACQLAAQMPNPAVVLLDLRPRDTHGRALFDEIRRRAPQCRLLVLTTERRDDASPAWLGAQVIEKPFDLVDVVRLVSEAMSVGSST